MKNFFFRAKKKKMNCICETSLTGLLLQNLPNLQERGCDAHGCWDAHYGVPSTSQDYTFAILLGVAMIFLWKNKPHKCNSPLA